MAADPLDLVGSTSDAAFAVDERGRIVIWNRATEALLGYQTSAILGKSRASLRTREPRRDLAIATTGARW